MPSGVHKGKRIIITIPHEVDEILSEVAPLLGTRKATLLAQWTEELVPVLDAVLKAKKGNKIDHKELEKAMGLFLLHTMTGAIGKGDS